MRVLRGRAEVWRGLARRFAAEKGRGMEGEIGAAGGSEGNQEGSSSESPNRLPPSLAQDRGVIFRGFDTKLPFLEER